MPAYKEEKGKTDVALEHRLDVGRSFVCVSIPRFFFFFFFGRWQRCGVCNGNELACLYMVTKKK